jgi:hypothetical protein
VPQLSILRRRRLGEEDVSVILDGRVYIRSEQAGLHAEVFAVIYSKRMLKN